MAPQYKQEHYLIIQPGSHSTLVKFGLDDTLSPPTYSIPTKIYQSSNNADQYTMIPNDKPIFPIVKGSIENVKGLNFLLKSVLKSVLKLNPTILLSQIPLVIVQTSANWSPASIESITNYVFEAMSLPSLSIVPTSLCCLFAYGSTTPNACVVDVGYQKSEISIILDYQVFIPGSKTVSFGGDSINERLSKLLPQFNESQLESLKKSNIFEVLSAEDASASFFGSDALKEKTDDIDDGVLDIAAIVTSEKSTREILAEKEKELKNKKSQTAIQSNGKPNSELESNSFVDSEDNVVVVGKERFQGCNELIESITKAIYKSISKIPDLKRAQECYDNLILVGQTSQIKGFKEALFVKLHADYAIGYEQAKSSAQRQNQSTFRNTGDLSRDLNFVQVPKHIKFLTKPEYFSEWKKYGFEDCSFLGAEILAKMVFGSSSNSELYLSKEEYLEKGPMGIWHVKM
ncbi:hypothetical protein CANARDRAFT_29632 [[Candida] arabinofermentans NRRL YB-2248]|uniref:Actin-like protein ARP9 n=1 Tax=[Candida] arabinofermentans NRRL YB-2248 TaxID=983967 RepID=A0A1E4SWM6_9ASCO|nr:hypothetical protein CANARDRAFT_29632 [[Candida] arabinofermentans NRRL YB-2248]